jgi:hypothetical protein
LQLHSPLYFFRLSERTLMVRGARITVRRVAGRTAASIRFSNAKPHVRETAGFVSAIRLLLARQVRPMVMRDAVIGGTASANSLLQPVRRYLTWDRLSSHSLGFRGHFLASLGLNLLEFLP